MKRFPLFLAVFAILSLVFACTSPVTSFSDGSARAAGSITLTGPNGSVVVSGMTATSLTVSYTPGASISSANLYVTQGNGTGLVLAAQGMTNNAGTWSYTFSHPSFVAGAKIALDVLKSAGGVETNVPQGVLADATTWASFTYASSAGSYTVTYDSQGATVAANPTSQTVTSPATTVGTLPTAPTKTGYTFGGWFTAVNGGGTAFTATTTVSASLTVYAKWTATTGGNITLTGPNGSVVVSGMTGTNLTVSYTPGATISSANLYVTQGNGTGLVLANQGMTNSGGTYSYTFSNASFVSGAKISLDILKTAGGVETNVPQGVLADSSTWASFNYATSTGSYTVSYDSQGATVAASPTSQTVTSPATTVGTLPTAPTKTGYTFGGWFTAVNGGGTAFTATTTVTASLTVYAKWNASGSYTVSYDSQGATVAASPTSQTVTSPATTVGTLPTAPTKTNYTFGGWFTAVNGGGTAFTATTTVTASLTVYAKWTPTGAVNFGPNVIIFDPSMSSATIQSQVDAIYTAQRTNQFGSNRYALLFKPGTYNVNVNVGFYEQILGLSQSPDGTNIVGSIQADGSWDPDYNVTQNFWRAVENIAVTPSNGTDMWAVSQAAPMRRVHVKGGLWLFNINPNTGASGWASGGFLSDSLIDGQVNSGGQQQWFSRNSQWGSWSGSVWNMVFTGNVNAPANTFPNPPNTTIAQTPVVKEKPYLYIDASGNYNVFVPSLRSNSQGISWSGGNTPGTSLPISQFYVANSASDTASSLNAALASGKNLLLTPGVYTLNDTLRVNNANTIVLGLGMATLLTTSGVNAMSVADVDGVEIAGILFDAGPSSAYQLQVGPTGSSASHSANPTLLSDLFFRIGGATAGSTTASLVINSANVIGDDFWLWRADHGNAGTWGWTANPSANGLIVNGANVTLYGLAVEHYQQYQVQWNANGGKVYFYQSEEPYDVPNQAAWMNGSSNGWASYKVANTVTSHSAYGVGVYCFFNVNTSVALANAFEVPTAGLNGVMMHNMTTVSLGGVGTISHIINGLGATANSASNIATLVQ